MTIALGLFGLFIVGLVIAGMVLIARDATHDVHSVGHAPDTSNLSPVTPRAVAADVPPAVPTTAD